MRLAPADFVCSFLPIIVAAVAFAAQPRSVAGEPELSPLPGSVPAPEDNPTTSAKVELGRQLFFDPRLSGDDTTSCATCHLPDRAFTDGQPKPSGAGGQPLSRNVPTLLNVGLLDRYFWDGRAESLEQQALIPIQSPDEMNQDLDELEAELQGIAGYAEQFRQVFGERVTRQGIAQALAAFQRTLVSGPSPLDRFLDGERNALSADARAGYELFIGDAGCVRCHNGPLLSDGKFYRIGVGSDDRGRAAITGDKQDDAKYRTPSLRNVAQTGPYMHDGSMQTLDEVVEYYYRGAPTRTVSGQQLDITPLLGQSYSEIPLLEAFLQSLTGEAPHIEPPELP
ncbi:MAG: cytochrome c peroxidase [Pirellulales bacterium]